MAGEKDTLPYRLGQLERALIMTRYWGTDSRCPVARPYCQQMAAAAADAAAAVAWLYRGALQAAREE